MAPQAETRDFIAAAFQAWRQASIPAVVLRNYQELPAQATNDIDVLVPFAEARRAEDLLLEAAQRYGFRLHNRAAYATLALYFHSASGAQVHFDLFTGFTWRGLPYLHAPTLLQQRRTRPEFDVPHPLHEDALKLLGGLLHAGKVKAVYRASIATTFREHAAAAKELLATAFGQDTANALYRSIETREWATAEALARRLRFSLLYRAFLNEPFGCCYGLGTDFLRLLRRWLRPPGFALVLCGPDGCGKSTVGPLAAAALERSFPGNKGAAFHWKPAVFSRQRQLQRDPATDPHGQTRRGPAASLLFFAMHWLEFLLGWFLHVRPVLFRGGLVRIDRGYYDFFVDQRRYRLRVPNWILRLGQAFLPAPDLVCILDAPPEVLRRRKQEVTPEETARQRSAYLDLAAALPNARIISAEPPPDSVAGSVVDAVLETCARRLQR